MAVPGPWTAPAEAWIEPRDLLKCLRVRYREQNYLIPYDFLQTHPGGAHLLKGYVNGDMTHAFDAVRHSAAARDILELWAEDVPEDYREHVRHRIQSRARHTATMLSEDLWRGLVYGAAAVSVALAWVVRN